MNRPVVVMAKGARNPDKYMFCSVATPDMDAVVDLVLVLLHKTWYAVHNFMLVLCLLIFEVVTFQNFIVHMKIKLPQIGSVE